MDEPPAETVLIVEGDLGVAGLERLRLERAGYGVLTAATAGEVLDHLGTRPVHLILLADRLPGDNDGLRFYGEAKKAGHDVPVVLMTGPGGEATVIEALRLGASDSVTKSGEYLDYLPETVARVLRQVRVEQRLAESEAQLASIISSARDAILVAGADGLITLFNAAAEKMFHCSTAEALGQPLARFLPEAAGPLLEEGGRLAQAAPPREAVVSHGEVGGRKFSTVVVRDITERKQAEEVLRESEERFRTFMDNSPTISFIKDEAGRYVYLSNTSERLLGRKPADQIGKTDDEVWPADVAAALHANDRAVLESGQPLEVEETVPTQQGRMTTWLCCKFPFENRFRLFVGGVAIDITGQKRTQEQLRQAQKMDAIGKLAGGVAHDFNNLLTVILGYTELLLRRFGGQEEVLGILREVHKAGERAALLTHKLLAFSRQKKLAPVVLDLNQLVRESVKMFRRLLGATIDVRCSLQPGLGRVRADPGGLEQVLLNLVVNAHDAMPNGGVLTLETRNVEVEEAYRMAHPEACPGPYVLLAVSDTGHGMDEATTAQIFEAFFTTKEAGHGTGLGLAMVHGLVKQSGGHIEVASEPGRGTTFKIYLPRVLDSGGSEAPPVRELSVPRGTETVLLAEDEPAVREVARTALLSAGYTVLEGSDGQEALAMSQQHAGPIHLLVTDVVMPRMSGRQLADQLTADWPNLKVLYISGYTDDAILRHGVLEQGMAFLQKPFTPIVLARKVREVLSPPGG